MSVIKKSSYSTDLYFGFNSTGKNVIDGYVYSEINEHSYIYKTCIHVSSGFYDMGIITIFITGRPGRTIAALANNAGM